MAMSFKKGRKQKQPKSLGTVVYFACSRGNWKFTGVFWYFSKIYKMTMGVQCNGQKLLVPSLFDFCIAERCSELSFRCVMGWVGDEDEPLMTEMLFLRSSTDQVNSSSTILALNKDISQCFHMKAKNKTKKSSSSFLAFIVFSGMKILCLLIAIILGVHLVRGVSTPHEQEEIASEKGFPCTSENYFTVPKISGEDAGQNLLQACL